MPMILDTPPRSPSPLHESNTQYLRRRDHHESDVLVVGAGIFGCAIAITLARQGRSVILLERWMKEPDRIVGELLQPGGVAALEKLGLRECLEDIDAIRVLGYEVIFHGDGVVVPYPENSVDPKREEHGTDAGKRGDSIGRPEGRSFHHGRFVRRLREVAMKERNITVVESTATAIVKDGTSGQVLGMECSTNKEPDYYFAHLTIISDGYNSKFRPATVKSSSSSKFYALELQDAVLPSPLHGHVILSDSAPTLLYQIGTHETRALIDIPTDCPTASVAAGGVQNHLRNVILPILPESVQPSFRAALDEGKLPKSMPNSFLAPRTNTTPGLCMLGDAMNMRHPLTGGGMTVAFNDVVLLRELLSPENVPTFTDTDLVLRQMKTFHWRRKGLSSVINILAMALYALFAADDEALRTLQNGCFRYFQLGGSCVSGPVGLLSGLIRQPFVLFYHFFSVAVYGMWLYVVEGTRRKKGEGATSADALARLLMLPYRAIMSLAVFWKACVVIFPYIFSELRA